MQELVVERASIAVSSKPSTVITARSLGSTLAVVATDPYAGVAGIGHCVLPGALGRPSGSPTVLEQMRNLFKNMLKEGAAAKDMKIFLCGAATFLYEPMDMALGIKLYKTAIQALRKNGLTPSGEHVGGPLNRSVSVEAGSSNALVVLPDKKEIRL